MKAVMIAEADHATHRQEREEAQHRHLAHLPSSSEVQTSSARERGSRRQPDPAGSTKYLPPSGIVASSLGASLGPEWGLQGGREEGATSYFPQKGKFNPVVRPWGSFRYWGSAPGSDVLAPVNPMEVV